MDMHDRRAGARLTFDRTLDTPHRRVMPLLFSYGSLQREDVQLSTFGRRLAGHRDELPGFEPTLAPIKDPALAARLGKTHHANASFTGNAEEGVPGTVFEVTEAELARADEYEAGDDYARVTVKLASGRQAWVYIYSANAR